MSNPQAMRPVSCAVVSVVTVLWFASPVLASTIYSGNPDMNGQFSDAVLVNRNPDCRAYATDANDGDYGSSLISDLSNGISDAVSDVHIDLVIASNWNASAYDYESVTLTNDPELATHCRMTSNMIPNHTFGVEVTGPRGRWVGKSDRPFGH